MENRDDLSKQDGEIVFASTLHEQRSKGAHEFYSTALLLDKERVHLE